MKEIFKNCLMVDETDKGYFPCRFTQKQLEVYRQRGPAAVIRSRCTASVCMSFITAKEEIAFSYFIASFARNNVTFDVYENDRMVTTIPQPDGSPSGRILYRKRNTGETKITIYLPPCAEVLISELDIGEYKPIPDSQKKLLLLGDSITQGMTSKASSLIYATLVGNALGCSMLNQGVGGYIFNKDSLDENLPFTPDVIWVAYGTNDYTESLSTGMPRFERMCREYLEKLIKIYPHTPIFVQTPIPRFDFESEEQKVRFSAVREFIRNTVLSLELSVVDGFDLIPEHRWFFADGVHPNELGFLLYARNLEKTLVF